MIIDIEIENWMSFRDNTKFSMLASLERQHNERIAKVPKFPLRILPITSIYGGNASGKSMFFKGICFAKDFIVEGLKPDEPIPVVKYRLDKKYLQKPTLFRFTLLIDECVYDYSFSVNADMVVNEKLIRITSATEKILFERDSSELVHLDTALENQEFLNFAFQGTNDNQLYLTNSVFQKVVAFKPVFDFFKKTLMLISPEGLSGPSMTFVSKDNPIYDSINKTLRNFDTGVVCLESEEVSLDSLPFPSKLKDDLAKRLTGPEFAEFVDSFNKERYLFSKENGNLIAKKIVSYHQQADGKNVKFQLADESDGTIRLIDLLPGFYNMASPNNNRVYIIDELNRSLHSLLTRQLINIFLCNCSEKTRSQLIFTTHDLLLMDQTLLRRDEMWISERNQEGASSLISFAEFKDVRSDKDIRKSYLQGRLGGIPKVLVDECFINADL